MLAGILSTGNVSFVLVFFEGLLSFLSPCVIPLIPIYMSYLAGNAKKVDENGIITYQQKKVFFHTLFFVLGISFAFFILGMSFTTLGTFFKSNQLLFSRIGGIIIIVLGLYQIGLLDFKFLQRERKINLKLGGREMNPILALVMGFTFSFAWIPCVGPALSSVLIMASGAGNSLVGNLLVMVYTVGFIIPFLLLGLFTAQVLNFLKGHQKILKYTVKVGGALLLLIGIMTFTGWMNGVSKYLNTFTLPSISKENTDVSESTDVPNITDVPADTAQKVPITPTTSTTAPGGDSDSGTAKDSASDAVDETAGDTPTIIPAFDFTLVDQYGKEHTLSDYKGKIVFLNFWATWCSPCKEELPDIEKLYMENNQNQEDVIILGVANPSSETYPQNSDGSKEEVTAFLKDNGYTFPVVFDETGEVLKDYYITAFPTTFMIDKKGNIYGYAPGQLTKDIMNNFIQKTLDSTE